MVSTTGDDTPPAGSPTAGQAVLSLTARYGKDLPVINGGLVWRVFADKPDDNGTYKLIREERGATPGEFKSAVFCNVSETVLEPSAPGGRFNRRASAPLICNSSGPAPLRSDRPHILGW